MLASSSVPGCARSALRPARIIGLDKIFNELGPKKIRSRGRAFPAATPGREANRWPGSGRRARPSVARRRAGRALDDRHAAGAAVENHAGTTQRFPRRGSPRRPVRRCVTQEVPGRTAAASNARGWKTRVASLLVRTTRDALRPTRPRLSDNRRAWSSSTPNSRCVARHRPQLPISAP